MSADTPEHSKKTFRMKELAELVTKQLQPYQTQARGCRRARQNSGLEVPIGQIGPTEEEANPWVEAVMSLVDGNSPVS